MPHKAHNGAAPKREGKAPAEPTGAAGASPEGPGQRGAAEAKRARETSGEERRSARGLAPRRGDALTRRLRRKIVFVATGALALTLAVLCCVTNIGVYSLITQRADNIIDLIHEGDGAFSAMRPPENALEGLVLRVTSETPFETRYAVASFSADGSVTATDVGHVAALDEEAATAVAASALEAGSDRGYYDSYRFAVFRDEDGGGTVVLLDSFQQLQSCRGVLAVSVAAALACLAVVFIALIPLSHLIAKPFERNIERQKRFVTDASHELKTPLAIISANNDLTECETGPTRWTRSTRTQVARLEELIGNLIDLSRAAEPIASALCTRIDVGCVAKTCCESFAPFAEAEGKTIEAHVEEGTFINGVADDIERLCSILIDNAVRHSDDDATITVAVQSRLRSVMVTVSNPCAALDARDLPGLFERFSRADESRGRASGGYGIGLSMAQLIVERHGGRIGADKIGDEVRFTATFKAPTKGRARMKVFLERHPANMTRQRCVALHVNDASAWSGRDFGTKLRLRQWAPPHLPSPL